MTLPRPLTLAPLAAVLLGLALPAAAGDAAAGVTWTVPARWSAQPERAMRVATYSIPAAKGEADGAECAVYFFGTGQGGDAPANIARWASQFQENPKPAPVTKKLAGLDVTTVDLAGTYLAPGGPMMQSQGRKASWRMLGAVVAAPQGNVFVKLTGPAASVAQAAPEFEALLGSLAPQGDAPKK